MQNYREWLNENWEDNNMFPPPMDAQVAINFLEKYLLGEDWYIVNPITTSQANVEIVHEILYKYSKKYRKELKLEMKAKRKKEKLK